jgi:hypothetical protein
MKCLHKQNNVTVKVILLLFMCCVVWGDTPPCPRMHPGEPRIWNDNAPIVEEVVMKTVTVYLGERWTCCTDTLIIEGINLRVGRKDSDFSSIGYGDAARDMRILLPDTNSFLSYVSPLAGRPKTFPTWWKKGCGFYPAVVDSTSWEKLMNIIESFEEGPSSCLRDCWP